MAGEFHMETVIGNTRYFLNRAACVQLLGVLETFGEACGDPCKRLRGDLRKALAMTGSQTSGVPVVESETTVEFALRPDQPEAARCAWCGEAGEALPMRPGDTEALYVCRTPGCQRQDKPAVLSYFTTGFR